MFQRATKTKRKLRLAFFGPSGSGKTYSALAIASGMSDRVAVVDTEHYSASLYADTFTFDTQTLEQPGIDEIITAITEAREYDVLIIDSITHPWQELLADIDQLAKAKYKGNTWSAWSDGTPKQKRLIRAITTFPGHLIVTMRSKTEWTTTETKSGHEQPQRVGLAPEQGKGIEYEFDMLGEVSAEHIVQIIKDRTGKYQDALLEKPGPEFGRDLVAWLETGADPEPTYDELVLQIRDLVTDWPEERKAPVRERLKKISKGDAKSVKALLDELRQVDAEPKPAPADDQAASGDAEPANGDGEEVDLF